MDYILESVDKGRKVVFRNPGVEIASAFENNDLLSIKSKLKVFVGIVLI